ncbi:MAG: AtpZ/AtpI family protein [Bryobacteraceae bacterium]
MVARKKPFAAMVGEYTSLAMMLPAATCVGWVLGRLADKALGTTYLYIPGLVLGSAAGLVELVRTVTRDSGDDDS